MANTKTLIINTGYDSDFAPFESALRTYMSESELKLGAYTAHYVPSHGYWFIRFRTTKAGLTAALRSFAPRLLMTEEQATAKAAEVWRRAAA